jgi:hypothetical protein
LAGFKEWNFALAVRQSRDRSGSHGVIYFSPHPLSVSQAIRGRFPVTVYPAAYLNSYDPVNQSIDALEYVNNRIRPQLLLLGFIQSELTSLTPKALFSDIEALRKQCANCSNSECSRPKASTGG